MTESKVGILIAEYRKILIKAFSIGEELRKEGLSAPKIYINSQKEESDLIGFSGTLGLNVEGLRK